MERPDPAEPSISTLSRNRQWRYRTIWHPGRSRHSANHQECRHRRQLVHGPHIEPFEQEFARFLGSGHVRACSTEYGRMALYFILKAMDFPAGSEIIVPGADVLGRA